MPNYRSRLEIEVNSRDFVENGGGLWNDFGNRWGIMVIRWKTIGFDKILLKTNETRWDFVENHCK